MSDRHSFSWDNFYFGSDNVQCPTVILSTEPLTIFAKNYILDIWQGSDYASGLIKLTCHGSKICGYMGRLIYAKLIIAFTPN